MILVFLPSPHLCSRSSTVVDVLLTACLTSCGTDISESVSQSAEAHMGTTDLTACLQLDERPKWMFSPRLPLKYFLHALHMLLLEFVQGTSESNIDVLMNLNEGILI